MRLIVGLGNPGKDYEHTRHNAGFMVLDALHAKLEQARDWKDDNNFRTQVARGRMTCCEDVLLAKPLTFMNASGQSVAAILHYYKLNPADLLIIHDEVDIPLGELRLSHDASAAGHNGVQSVIDALSTKKFWRLRMGIGPHGGKAEQFVLQNFKKDETKKLHEAIKRAVEGVEEMFTNGPHKAQNNINIKT